LFLRVFLQLYCSHGISELFTVFESILPALFFGLLCGNDVCNLDRSSVSKHGEKKKRVHGHGEWKLVDSKSLF